MERDCIASAQPSPFPPPPPPPFLTKLKSRKRADISSNRKEGAKFCSSRLMILGPRGVGEKIVKIYKVSYP